MLLKSRKKLSLLILGVSLAVVTLQAQDVTKNKYGKGLRVMAADSSFSLKFGFRIQSLYQGELNLDDDDYNDEFQVRRARLKFDGFAYHPSVEYKFELGVSNADMSSGAIDQSGNVSNMVFDAYVKWNFYGNWSVLFGQTKLPGNRERVISSQAMQFVDRSNVNARFNIDRDAGVHLLYNTDKFNFITALTLGEGRNMLAENAGGYDYTFRGEYLPFGAFKNKGDYFGADLSREPKPKLSIGVTYDFNDGASRERGQLGDFLPANRDLSTWFIDAHFKYNGWSSLFEYANKKAPEGPVVYDVSGDFLRSFYTGQGFTWQAGYVLKNNLEFAGRYTEVTPEAITRRNKNTQYTLGVSRYFNNHNFKIQTDLTYIQEDTRDDVLMYRLQVEFGF